MACLAVKEGMLSVNSAAEAEFINIKEERNAMNGSSSENAEARKRNRIRRRNVWEDHLKLQNKVFVLQQWKHLK